MVNTCVCLLHWHMTGMPGFCSDASDFNMYDVVLFTVSQSPCSDILYHHSGCIPHRRLWLREAIVIHRPRCFHSLCIFSGIWITIPLGLRICWPNEPTWLIDTGDHQSSHSSSPVVNKHWIFYLTKACLIMDHFNLVGKKKNPLQGANTCLTMPDHSPRVLNPHKKGEEEFQGNEMMIAL